MKKFYKKNKKLVGIIFLLAAVTFFVFWEFVGRNKLLNKEVIVLSSSVFSGTVITEDMLIRTKVDINSYIDNAVNDSSQIVGLEAKHYIPAKTQLVKEYFDYHEFVLDNDEKIMKIPDSWILTIPETLRRKDKVYFYAVKNNEINEEQDKRVRDTKLKEKLFLFWTTVAYVKDNSNREVESLDVNRLIGSSTISVVEVVITDKNFEVLKQYVNDGYTFALLYQ